MNSPRIGRAMSVILRAIGEVGKRAVVLTGWWDGGGVTGGPGVHVAEAVPHSWLLPRVSAVIHHGGAGTVAAALRAGVPSIVAPFFFDQWFWAQWLHRRGLGPEPLSLRGVATATVTRALAAADDAASDSQGLQLLSRKLEQEDGVGRAIAAIEAAAGLERTSELAATR